MHKCEIEGCKKETEKYLCETHRKMAMSDDAKFKICRNCNVIITVSVRENDKDKYTFVDECQTCKFN